MSKIESDFELKNIQIIFADKLISDVVWGELGIKGTCTLCCDDYHLFQEDWIKYLMNIHIPKYDPVLTRCCLPGQSLSIVMLIFVPYPMCRTMWNIPPTSRRCTKSHHTIAGYYLRDFDRNLELKGLVPAEQNHSSIVAHLGKGTNWSVVEHTSQLCTYLAHIAHKFHKLDNRLQVQVSWYKFGLVGSQKYF
jgi:hypothetical protein